VVDEQPIDIHHYSRAIRAALPRIGALAVVAAAVAVAFSLVHPSGPSYTASTTVLARDALDSTQTTNSTNIGQRLATVNLLTRTTGVLSLAARRLHGTSVDDLRAAVRSSVDPAAAVITVVADAPTSAAAAARANAVAAALIAREQRIEERASTDARRNALAELAHLKATGADKLAIQAVKSQIALLAAGTLGAVTGFQVLQAAEPPTRSAGTSPWMSGVVVFFAAMLLGMLVVLAREQVSPRVSSVQNLGQLLSVPVLASIPVGRHITRRDLSRLPPAVRDGFYVLASSVRRDARRNGSRVVLVTSAVRGEGRTTVAANLARALSTSGAGVLVVSADLRNPRIHRWFGVAETPGLSDLLGAVSDEGVSPAAAAQSTAKEPVRSLDLAIHPARALKYGTLAVLPGGTPIGDNIEILFTDALPTLFRRIRALPYDFIVIDGPPVLQSADFAAIALHVDSILVVVRADRMHMSLAAELREGLELFEDTRRGLAVIDRRQHPIADPAPADLSTTRVAAASGEREVVDVR
jgi:Mrp family chromosome partitioning ATPase